jgi:hypothetical protein
MTFRKSVGRRAVSPEMSENAQLSSFPEILDAYPECREGRKVLPATRGSSFFQNTKRLSGKAWSFEFGAIDRIELFGKAWSFGLGSNGSNVGVGG